MSANVLKIIALTVMASQLACGPAALGQVRSTWIDPPSEFSRSEALDISRASGDPPARRVSKNSLTNRRQAAVDFAAAYLNEWSSPNRVTLASTSDFYGPRLLFHGRERSFQSVFAEKRQFAKRWPKRSYQYRPELTQVACDDDEDVCTVWSLFDFSAVNRQGGQSRGLGEHELVVSFAANKPMIVAETSRVLRRGAIPSR
jgi:hypothetical protein